MKIRYAKYDAENYEEITWQELNNRLNNVIDYFVIIKFIDIEDNILYLEEIDVEDYHDEFRDDY